MRKFSKKRNLEYNKGLKEHPVFAEMINGQALGAVSAFRYGLCRMSFNGCEVIAVHNALVYLGIPQNIEDIAFYMERFRMLGGFFGCSPFGTGRALRHFGAENAKTKDTSLPKAFIMTFWTKRPFLSSLHTVFCVKTDCGLEVYNRFNSCPGKKIYGDIREITGKNRPVAVYSLMC